MRTLFHFFIIAFYINSITAYAQFTSPRFQRITLAEGLPNGEVHQIKEDDSGFIWLGTSEGICRYDGYKIELLRGYDIATTKAIAKDRPIFFDWDEQKHWWIGSDWAGVRVFDALKSRLSFLGTSKIDYPHYEMLDTLENTFISAILCDNNRVWLGCYQGIQVFDKTKRKLDKNPQLIPSFFKNNEVRRLRKDVNGNIWAAVFKKGLLYFDKKTETWSVAVSHANVRDFTFNSEGEVYWISNEDLYHFNPKTQKLTKPFGEISAYMSPKTALSVVHCDKKGRVWAGSTNGLLLLEAQGIPPQLFQHNPRDPYSLLSNFIYTLYEDSKNNIWVGCGGDGVCMIPNSFERIQTFDNKTTIHRVEDLDIAPDSTIYALTRTHLMMSRSPYYKTTFLTLSNLIPCSATIVNMAIGKNGKIYLLSSCGIWLFSPRTKTCQLITSRGFNTQDLQNTTFLSFNIFGDTLLTYSYESEPGLKVFNLKTGSSRFFNRPDLNQNIIFTQGMIQSQAGDFWSSSFQGLIKLGALKKETDRFYQAHQIFNWGKNQESSNSGKPILLINDDIWWGRYDGGGLNVLSLRDSAYTYFLKENGLYDNAVISLSLDKAGYVWAGTNLGISRIQLPTDFRKTTRLVAQNFSTADGLPHNTVLCSTTTWDKKQLFVGTAGGLAMINTEGVASDSIQPKIVFSNLSILNKIVRVGDSTNVLKKDINNTASITLQHDQTFFTLEVSGLNFVNPQQTRYAYRLSESGSDWIDNGFSNTISFNNIASGNYILDVKAQASNGLWSPVKSLNIQVLPPIWKRWWFISLFFLSVIGAVYTFYKWRLKQIQKLQTLQNNIAADLHDDIGAALTNIEILSFLSKNQLPDTEKTQTLLEKISEEAKKTNESLHQLVWAMRSENDGLDKTLAQLNRLAVDSLEVQNISFSVKMPDITEGVAANLTGEKRRDLIMVFKEVLANITKHAQANAVWMRVEVENHTLKIDIEDNGLGIQPKRENGGGGNGLKNMQNRMARYKGSVDIVKSTHKGGVLVKIRLPL